MKMFASAAQGRDNNFNLVRMVAATAVLVSHSWPIALGPGTVEPLYDGTGYKLGTTAVIIFFTISGFFIAKSFDRRASLYEFTVARAARLYPALFVALTLTVALGAFWTELAPADYALAKHTWTYLPKNLLLWQPQWALPGVFTHNVYGDAINGSLWTLYYEVLCYAMVAVTGLAGMLRSRTFPIFLLILLTSQFFLRHHDTDIQHDDLAMLLLPFAFGMACYVFRESIPLSWVTILALTALCFATRSTAAYYFLYPLALCYGALWLGFAKLPLVARYNALGDYSYGMYIYAFPVQQALVATIGTVSPLALMTMSLPITLAIAILSWTFVEKPVLSRRHSLAQAIPRLAGLRR